MDHQTSSASQPSAETDSAADLVTLSLQGHPGWRQLSRVLALGWIACCFTGCSLFVMAGKMFFGDPQTPSAFTRVSGVDLSKEEKSVVIVCTAPSAARAEHSSVDLEILEGLSRRLKVRGVKVVDENKVATWLDDHGSFFEPDDAEEFAQSFPEADYLIHIDIEKFSYHEENSANLFRGRLNGSIKAWELKKSGEAVQTFNVFSSDFNSVYPTHYPQSVEQISGKLFLTRYVDRVCHELTLMFTTHRASETVY